MNGNRRGVRRRRVGGRRDRCANYVGDYRSRGESEGCRLIDRKTNRQARRACHIDRRRSARARRRRRDRRNERWIEARAERKERRFEIGRIAGLGMQRRDPQREQDRRPEHGRFDGHRNLIRRETATSAAADQRIGAARLPADLETAAALRVHRRRKDENVERWTRRLDRRERDVNPPAAI